MNSMILDFLKIHGEQLETDIAKALRLPIKAVKADVAQLSSAGEIVCCNVTRYLNGIRVDGVSCRLSLGGPLPKAKPGPKPGAKQP
jgi:hypothetical protein